MRKLILVVALFFTVSLAFTSCKTEKRKENTEEVSSDNHDDMEVYQCPMECEKDKKYDKEGDCPVCKMKLKKITSDEHNDHDEPDEENDNH